MPELMIDFITSLEGYGAADGWPGWWGLEGPEYLAWLAENPEGDYLVLMGANPVEPVPTFMATCTQRLKKAPGRTEFQRGILTRGADGALSVRPTGEQGSGILKSMSDANCFIILGDATGNVEPGTTVEVQLMEGVV